jgi:hypothetical protein
MLLFLSSMPSAYQPFAPARRPNGKPDEKPSYRVLVHRKFANHWDQVADRVGLQQAQQFWDHVSQTPGSTSGLASITILKGKAGRAQGAGWSRTHHYELSGAGRVDYQYHNEYRDGAKGDSHPVVAILTINYSSH